MYASAVLAVVILSVHLSVCHTRIFLYHTKGQSLYFSDPNSGLKLPDLMINPIQFDMAINSNDIIGVS